MSQEKAPASRERVARSAVITGSVASLIMLIAVLLARSTIVFADFCNTILEFSAVFISWLTIVRIERGKLSGFEYGTEKLESLASMLVGAAMLGCMGMISAVSILKIMHPVPVGGVGVWFTIAAQAVYFCINGTLFRRSRAVYAHAPSAIVASQVRLFAIKTLENLFVLAALALSFIFREHKWGQYLDPAGSLVIAGIMLLGATGTISSAFRDLVDRSIEEAQQIAILRGLADYFDDFDALHGIRTRRSGRRIFIEIFLEFAPGRTAAEVHETADKLRNIIQEAIPGSQVAIALAREKIR